MLSQDQEKQIDRYRLHKNWNSNDTVYIKVVSKDTLKKGWTIKGKKGDIEYQFILDKDSIIEKKVDSAVKVLNNWKISEIQHKNEEPGKLYLNPYTFTEDKKLNTKGYIKIPDNSYAVLTKSFLKWSAITLPFSIRPSLNDTIGSKVTTDLKIGASISYNYNIEIFKNRRIEAKKSVYGLSLGLGFGLTKVDLDKKSTSLATTPLKEEENGLAFFVGPGVGINLKGFQVLGLIGWDIGLTDNVKKWNYNKENYYGLGLGIDLSVFGKL